MSPGVAGRTATIPISTLIYHAARRVSRGALAQRICTARFSQAVSAPSRFAGNTLCCVWDDREQAATGARAGGGPRRVGAERLRLVEGDSARRGRQARCPGGSEL